MSVAHPPPTSASSQRRRQCVAAVAAASAACLAPVAVYLAVLLFAPSLLPRLLLRPHHHIIPYVGSAELRRLSFDTKASVLAYNLSAVLRFTSPPGLYARRYTVIRAAPFYAGQKLGAAVALPGFMQSGGGAVTVRVAWAGMQRVPPGRRARAVVAALAREKAEGWVSVKVIVRATPQDGDESDFACVLGFAFAAPPKRGGAGVRAASMVSDGGSCIDAVRSDL